MQRWSAGRSRTRPQPGDPRHSPSRHACPPFRRSRDPARAPISARPVRSRSRPARCLHTWRRRSTGRPRRPPPGRPRSQRHRAGLLRSTRRLRRLGCRGPTRRPPARLTDSGRARMPMATARLFPSPGHWASLPTTDPSTASGRWGGRTLRSSSRRGRSPSRLPQRRALARRAMRPRSAGHFSGGTARWLTRFGRRVPGRRHSAPRRPTIRQSRGHARSPSLQLSFRAAGRARIGLESGSHGTQRVMETRT